MIGGGGFEISIRPYTKEGRNKDNNNVSIYREEKLMVSNYIMKKLIPRYMYTLSIRKHVKTEIDENMN